MRSNQENYAVGVPVQQKAPKNLRRKVAAIGAGVTTAIATQVNAAPLDVSGVTSAITENQTSLNTVAVAVISVLVVVMVVNMIRRLVR